MNNNFEKFIKEIIKNPNFLILKSEENLLILGVKLNFVEHIVNDNNVFTPAINLFTKREWPVFFLVTNKSTLSETEKMFIRKGMPIFNLSKEKNWTFTEKNVNEKLEEFIKNNFRNSKDPQNVKYF